MTDLFNYSLMTFVRHDWSEVYDGILLINCRSQSNEQKYYIVFCLAYVHYLELLHSNR